MDLSKKKTIAASRLEAAAAISAFDLPVDEADVLKRESTDEVGLRVTPEGPVIDLVPGTRAGWADAAQRLVAGEAGSTEDPFLATDFDEADRER